MTRRIACIAAVVLLQLTGCSGAQQSIEATASATLIAWQPAQATRSPTRPEATSEVELTPEASPTPLTHFVEEGETLLDIAYRYGVELNVLLVANPGINPRFMSIGQALLIPGPEGEVIGALAPTTTPYPVQLEPAKCYPVPSGALWCLTTASHTGGGFIEGLALAISLLDSEFETLRSELAFSPLNLIGSEMPMPIGALFDAPLPEFGAIDLTVISSVFIDEIDGRYLPLEMKQDSPEKAPDGLNWTTSGTIEFLSSVGVDVRLVLVAAAYSAAGDLIGFKSWESVTQKLVVPYEITVFSLGPEIDHISIQAEALVLPE